MKRYLCGCLACQKETESEIQFSPSGTTPSSSWTSSSVPDSGIRSIDALISGYKWGSTVGKGTSLSYSFPWADGANAWFAGWNGEPYSDNGEWTAKYRQGLNSTQQDAAINAIQAWANVANISFARVQDNANTVGDIRFAFSSAESLADWWGYASYPNSYWPSGGDIWINHEHANDKDWSKGGKNYSSLLHEIGHTLGLKHPFAGTVRLSSIDDTNLYTVMSYTDAPKNVYASAGYVNGEYGWLRYYVEPETPMVLDIAAIQHLYGKNNSYRSGDDLYTFDPSTPFFRTIWDGGGEDTISLEGFDSGCVVSLVPGSFSSIRIKPASDNGGRTPTYDGTNNLGIAYECIIENVIGGNSSDSITGNDESNELLGMRGDDQIYGLAGDDSLYGGEGNDTFVGGTGDDYIEGGAGTDTILFNLAISNYSISYSGSTGIFRIEDKAGRGGVDRVVEVENFQFSDQRVTAQVLRSSFPDSVTLTLLRRSTSVNEGESAQFLLSTTNVATSTSLSYTVSGVSSNDIVGGRLSGSVTVGSDGQATISIPIAADNLTEGPETMTVTARSPQGTNVASTNVIINDTSKAPVIATYRLTASLASVNEGASVSFTLNTTNIAAATVLSYVISGVQEADIVGGQLSGSVAVGSDGQATISIPIAADNLTEGPETMTLTVRSAQGSDLATASVTINDTSLSPTMVFNQIQGTEGSDLLNGTSAADQINARGGKDTIVGSVGADTIDGGAGLDLVRYNSSSASASLSKNEAGEIILRRGSETDTLINVERLQFTDQWVAIDLNGAAGVAGRIIVAAFGRESLSEFSGIGISLVDQGWNSSQLAELIVSAGLLPSGNAEFVKVVYQNVIGHSPNSLELAFYVQLLENSSHTQGSLLELAANTDFSANVVEQSAIGLVGLSYQPSLI